MRYSLRLLGSLGESHLANFAAHQEITKSNIGILTQDGAMKFRDAVWKITEDDVIRALSEIDSKGVPRERRSRKWCLIHGSHRYPPKYVLFLAVRNATGSGIRVDDHPGGERTHGPLRKALVNRPEYQQGRLSSALGSEVCTGDLSANRLDLANVVFGLASRNLACLGCGADNYGKKS